MRKIMEDLNEQIVGEAFGQPISRGQFQEAFKKVHNSKNWKLPINAIVPLNVIEVEIMKQAIPFFVGSEPKVSYVGGGKYRIEAAGYYVSIGA